LIPRRNLTQSSQATVIVRIIQRRRNYLRNVKMKILVRKI